MTGRAPNGPLNAERHRGSARVVPLGQRFELVAQVLLEPLLEQARVAARVTNDVRRGLVEQQRVEQVLDGDVLVTPPRSIAGGNR